MKALSWINPLRLERFKNWLEGAASIDWRWRYKEVSAKYMEEKISIITRYSNSNYSSNPDNPNTNQAPLSDMDAIAQVFRWRKQGRNISILFIASAPFLYLLHTGFWSVIIALLPWLAGLFYCDFIVNQNRK